MVEIEQIAIQQLEWQWLSPRRDVTATIIYAKMNKKGGQRGLFIVRMRARTPKFQNITLEYEPS